MGGAIDTLEVRVPGEEFWARDLRRICRSRISDTSPLLQRQGGQYRQVVDLRGAGLSGILYLVSRVSGSNKLVISRAGGLPYRHILGDIGALFDVEVLALQVMRIDLAVDVVGYPMAWFRENVAVRRRYCRDEIGTVSYRTKVRRGIETMYFGRRPNLIRVYDKIAQLKAEGRRRKKLDDIPNADKESWPDGVNVTRVERQYGGKGIPSQLSTLGAIQVEGPIIDPFKPLEFSALGSAAIPDDLGGASFLKAFGLTRLIQERGCHASIAELNRRTGGKGKRLFCNVLGYRSKEVKEAPDLLALYRQSLATQLEQESTGRVGNAI